MEKIETNQKSTMAVSTPTGRGPTLTDVPSSAYIVDSDRALQREFRALLESVQIGVTTYNTAAEFLQDPPTTRPGCLLLGLRLPQRSGLALYRRLRAEGSTIPAIFLTPHEDVGTAVAAMQEGAFDFLRTPVHGQYLLDRVQAALARDLRDRRKAAGQQAAATRFRDLSRQERAVLDLMMAGRMRKDIARELGLARRAVGVHWAGIMKKVSADTLADLAYLYVTAGLDEGWPRRSPAIVHEFAGGTFT
jgi:two-component system response regulator TtrR